MGGGMDDELTEGEPKKRLGGEKTIEKLV